METVACRKGTGGYLQTPEQCRHGGKGREPGTRAAKRGVEEMVVIWEGGWGRDQPPGVLQKPCLNINACSTALRTRPTFRR